jgi:hypothetical protein
MPRASRPPIAKDERDLVAGSDKIRERLDEFVRLTFGSWYAFEQAADVPHATANAWKSGGGGLTLDSLLKFAQQGLSLDWLVTGHGTMKRRIDSSDTGVALERMIPHLQRAAGVGQFSAVQAFASMAVRFGHEGLIEKAATGLQPAFNNAIAELASVMQHQELIGWADTQLARLSEAAHDGTLAVAEAVIADWRARVAEHLPPDFRPDSVENRKFWDAIATQRNAFLRAAAANAGLTMEPAPASPIEASTDASPPRDNSDTP